MLLIRGFNATLKKFNLWFVSDVINIFATLGSRVKKSEYSDVILLIKLCDSDPLINLLVAYWRRVDIYYLICRMIFKSEFRSLICYESSLIYLSLAIYCYSFAILFCSKMLLAYSMLINLHISAKNYSLRSAST